MAWRLISVKKQKSIMWRKRDVFGVFIACALAHIDIVCCGDVVSHYL